MLTQDEIVDIANKEFKTQDPEHYESEIYYDVDHVKWKETLNAMKKDSPDFAERFKVLDGRDYQVVVYTPKSYQIVGGGYWVFVDSKTGEVITWFGEK